MFTLTKTCKELRRLKHDMNSASKKILFLQQQIQEKAKNRQLHADEKNAAIEEVESLRELKVTLEEELQRKEAGEVSPERKCLATR